VEKRNLTGAAAVVDGDTFDLSGTRIRVWGIDAIESSQQCFIGTQGWDCGAEATKALKDRLEGENVACDAQYKDRYGRTVAKCTVKGEDLGAWLVKTGMAVDFTRYSNGAYAAQQTDARARKVGIWRGDFEMPWDWRKEAKH
jgi:endonuclease YncB( thermonuclease family)